MPLNSKNLRMETLQASGQELLPKCIKEKTQIHKDGLTILKTLTKFMTLILGISKNISLCQKRRL